jgi:hypothetical protein
LDQTKARFVADVRADMVRNLEHCFRIPKVSAWSRGNFFLILLGRVVIVSCFRAMFTVPCREILGTNRVVH